MNAIWMRLGLAVGLATMSAACTMGAEPDPREFVVADASQAGNVDRLLVGPGVSIGQVFVDRIELDAGESAFESTRVAAGTVTFFVLSGEVDLVAAELEATLTANEVATFAAGLEHQLTASDAGPATVLVHTANPSDRRTDGED